jgi:hypothetical protein
MNPISRIGRFGDLGIFSFLLCLVSQHMLAQSGSVTSGGNFSNTSTQWSYTLGQPFHLELGASNQPRLNQGIQQTYQDNKITGFLRYDNTSLTPLNNCLVQLRGSGSVVAASATTNAGGAFELTGFADGSYSMVASTIKPWGGVNATDALRVRQHFTGSAPLAGMRLAVADVNSTVSINAADALLITRRFNNLSNSSFASGDWYFEPILVSANGQVQNINQKGLAFGDVNGSYVPGAARQPVRLDMSYDAVRYTDSGSELWLPVYADHVLEMGAISIVAQCPIGIEVLDLRSALGSEDLLWNFKDGEFRLGWSNVSGKTFAPGEPLFEIKVKGNSDAPWLLKDLSEIADLNAEPFAMVNLRIPKALPTSLGWHVALYPNPAGHEVNLNFDFLSGARNIRMELLDSRGRLVWYETYPSLESGRMMQTIPTHRFAGGRYLVRVQAQVGRGLDLVTQNLPLVIQH